MRIKSIRITRKQSIIGGIALFVLLVLVHAYTLFNVSVSRMLRGVVLIEDDRQTVVLTSHGDSVPISSRIKSFSTGFFVNRSGRIETRWHHPEMMLDALDQDSLKVVLSAQLDSARNRAVELQEMCDEMDYYAQSHQPTDSAYSEVMALRDYLVQSTDSVHRMVDALQDVLKGDELHVSFNRKINVYYHSSASGQVFCLPAETDDETHCRLVSEELPEGAYVFNPTSLRWFDKRRLALGFLRAPRDMSDSEAFQPQVLVLDTIHDSLPLPEVMMGAPIVDRRAHIRAVCTPDGWRENGGFSISPRSWWSSFRQWIAGWFSSDESEQNAPRYLIYNRVKEGKHYFTGVLGEEGGNSLSKHHFGRLEYDDGGCYEGFLDDSLRREGRGHYISKKGNSYIGVWHADSLPYGERLRERDHFVGHFNARLFPTGHGICRSSSYYVGEWKAGRRDGFGIGLIPGRIVCVGDWKADDYLGEQFVHRDSLVYGIDIARYQHEQGAHVYPIQWNSLRIVSLGEKIKQVVDGVVNYPVSFCYIKASEGIKTENKYCEDDASQARLADIRVGMYHFFSTKSGKEQAEWFLQHATLHHGDLPPMLDMELTDAKINEMGGADALFREMQTWLDIIRSRSHTTPILYLNQRFIDRYMSRAPKKLREYPVWVARYSKYRPKARNVIWQLTESGRVAGIQSPVDIDVFNGTREQYLTFLRKYCVK